MGRDSKFADGHRKWDDVVVAVSLAEGIDIAMRYLNAKILAAHRLVQNLTSEMHLRYKHHSVGFGVLTVVYEASYGPRAKGVHLW